ncbi:hypothetical protein ACFLQI_00470 [Candidatus Undinarchaeota archaeon]
MSASINQIKKDHGSKFIKGCKNIVKSMDIEKGETVIIAGPPEFKDLLFPIRHFALQEKEVTVKYFISTEKKILTEGSDEFEALANIIRAKKPSTGIFAYNKDSWPDRAAVFKVALEANDKIKLALMPGLPFSAVSNFLTLDPKKLHDATLPIGEFVKKQEGKDVIMITTDGTRDYALKGTVPGNKLGIHIDCQIPTKGGPVNFPGGEVYFQPGEIGDVNGEIFVPPGSVAGEFGTVEEGLTFEVDENMAGEVKALSGKDKSVAKGLNDALDAMGDRVVCEFGIGTHPHITLENSGGNTLLIEKVSNTFHIGFGENKKLGFGNISAKNGNHFDLVISSGKMNIGGQQIIPR